MERIEREEVYELISNSIFYGNLGYFIGAGFSKSVVNSIYTNPALSWGELISKSAEMMEINYEEILKEGYSYPEIATAVCEKYSNIKDIPYEHSKQMLKDKVCALTSWLPEESKRLKYSEIFSLAKPSWIITTNYDRVLESILVGKGFSVGPNEYLMSKKNLIPIYHMHGIRVNPESIILTQDDYVKLFRPNEYRQIKLSLNIRESTTLILGYSLGDMNVLSALDWSKNFYDGQSTFPHEVIQILRCESPKDYAYRDKNGILVLEIEEIDTFFDALCDYHKTKVNERAEIEEMLVKLANKFSESNDSVIEKFVNNQEMRKRTLKLLANFEEEVINSFMELLSNSLDHVWAKTNIRNAFGYYATYLEILLDIINEIDYENTPPVLFGKIAHSLDQVFRYVGYTPGESYAAATLWDRRKTEISNKYLIELLSFSERTDLYTLQRNLKTMVNVEKEIITV